jgi:hypothetical protein
VTEGGAALVATRLSVVVEFSVTRIPPTHSGDPP